MTTSLSSSTGAAAAAAASRSNVNANSSSSSNGRCCWSSRHCRRLLFRLVWALCVLALLIGSYWQWQLLLTTMTTEGGNYQEAGGGASAGFWALEGQLHSFLSNTTSSSSIGDNNNHTNMHSHKGQDEWKKVNETMTLLAKDNDNIPILQQALPLGFQSVLKRSKQLQDECNALAAALSSRTEEQQTIQVEVVAGNATGNDTKVAVVIADLPDFGIITALEAYAQEQQSANTKNASNSSTVVSSSSTSLDCRVPPATECNETRFTVVFMGYNPDRLKQMKRQVSLMITRPEWARLVARVLLVWNGPRALEETTVGKSLIQLAQQPHNDTRPSFDIVYPLKMGFPNDLMNRYHPQLLLHNNRTTAAATNTKAVLFYDDDGPFYSYQAVLSGFELWKRNANAQVGAMARKLDVVPSPKRQGLLLGAAQKQPTKAAASFVTQCRQQLGDAMNYNYFEFANYGANMVLPSGSFLHSDYLCFLWHPALEPIRAFVREHPVHPDDVTVSTIVSHVGGRPPLVYSRRINKQDNKKARQGRRLQQQDHDNSTALSYPRRRLLWQDVSKEDWAAMRSMAVNSLVSYFGGVNAGSVGWCHGTRYQTTNKKGEPVCDPWMASVGMLPWMTDNHEPKDTCP